jgi:CelD/BcsL family acetyltransferase involved in cellulose biosynthesis
MNVASGVASLRDQQLAPHAGLISRVEIGRDMAAAEPAWRGLQQHGAVASPYQSFDLLASWQQEVGRHAGVTPFIVVGFDSGGQPAFLLPLGLTRKGPLGIAGFLGDKHVNFNFGVWRRDIAAKLTADDVGAIVARIAEQGRADVFALLRQPRAWEGIANPLALLAHQSSPSGSLRLTLTAPGETLIKEVLSSAMRGRLLTKKRRLQRLPDYRYLHATTAADVDRLLGAFFPLKAAHMAAQALPNIFGEPGNETFLRTCCHHGLDSGNPLIEIHALEGGGELLALFAGISDGRRFSGMFNTYTLSDNARQSPGLVLLIHIISALADRGLQSFDLGVGEAHYKTFFCREPEPLFDSFLPLTPLGRLAAIGARAGNHAKRQIKQNRSLWSLAQALRKLRGQANDA